jgi:DNA-binding MarR family transcriptional regulator
LAFGTVDHFKQDPQKLGIGHLLAHVCRLVGRRRRMKLQSIGLRHAQGMILFRLWQADGMSQRMLAQSLHITPPTASSTLRRMERDGWIKRRRDESDQRIVRVHLTKAARRLREDARASFLELDKEMTSLLTKQEFAILRRSLLKVHDHLLRSESKDPGHARTGPTELPSKKE